MRGRALAVAAVLLAPPLAAQQSAPGGDLPLGIADLPSAELPLGQSDGLPRAAAGVVTLDKDRLFRNSRFGKRILGEYDAASRALAQENRTLETALEQEEQALTVKRATLPPEEFRVLAEGFDAKVVDARRRQEAKARALLQNLETERKRFFQTALPVLTDVLAEIGAVAILDAAAIIVATEQIDITEESLRRMDQVLGDGADPPAAEGVAPSQP